MAILGIGKKKPQSTQGAKFGDAAEIGLGLAALPFAPVIGAGLLGQKIAQKVRGDSPSLTPIKTAKELHAADVKALQQNPDSLGLTEQERQRYISDATSASQRAQQAQLMQLAQAPLSSPGLSQAEILGMQQQVLEQGDDTAVKAAAQANSLHYQLRQSEMNRIRNDVEAWRARKEEQTRYWLDKGIQGVGAVIAAATGGGAGIAAGIGGAAAASGGSSAAAAPVAQPSYDPSLGTFGLEDEESTEDFLNRMGG